MTTVISARTLGVTGLVLILVAGLLVGAGWGLQRRLIYFPEPSSVPPVSDVLPGAREVRLRTSDGLELGAWLVPATGSGRDVTVLVASGNAGDRSLRAPLAAALSRAGMTVLLFDYRGYGGNPGSPSEAGLALDVRAAHRYLTQDRRVPQGRLVYFGESLGTAVVTELATEHPPAGLVLRSPFVDLAAVGRAHYPYLPVSALLRDRYPVGEQLARIEVPTTVVYGTEDGIVPPEQSRTVAATAGGPTVLVTVRGAGHNDQALLDGAVLVRAVIELVDRATTGRT